MCVSGCKPGQRNVCMIQKRKYWVSWTVLNNLALLLAWERELLKRHELNTRMRKKDSEVWWNEKFKSTAIMHISVCQKPALTHHVFNTTSVCGRNDDSSGRQVWRLLVPGAERHARSEGSRNSGHTDAWSTCGESAEDLCFRQLCPNTRIVLGVRKVAWLNLRNVLNWESHLCEDKESSLTYRIHTYLDQPWYKWQWFWGRWNVTALFKVSVTFKKQHEGFPSL